MKRDQLSRRIHFVIRFGLLAAVLFSLFAAGGGVQTARATGTGSISGTVKDATSNLAITDYSIGVAALNGSGNVLVDTCTNPATGQYTLTGVPLGTPVKVLADGVGSYFSVAGCEFSSYGQEFWQHAQTLAAATPITLTSLSPTRTGINFTLSPAVPSIEYLVFNMDHTIIDEPAVRQAIAYGTDRQHILDTDWGPAGTYGTVPDSYVADNAWGAATTSTSPAVTAYPYSLTLANSTLDGAGWVVGGDGIRVKDGTTRLTLHYKTTMLQARQDTGASFVQEMQAIGVEVIPTYYDAGTFFGGTGPLATGDFDIAEYTTGNCASTQDKTCVPFPMFLTGNSANNSRYSNGTADSEYSAALASTNDTDRLLHDRTHQQIVMNDPPVLPIFTRTTGSISGVIKKLDGTPLTGPSVEVDALDSTGGQVATTCTNSANGYYTLTGIPAGTSVAVYASGTDNSNDNCPSNSHFYGWSYYSTGGDVTNLSDATMISLSSTMPTVGGINLALGENVQSIEYLVFNLDASTNNILRDTLVRQAIAYGTDRLNILNNAWLPNGTYGTVENSYVADNHWAKAPNSSVHLYPYNPAQAASVLDADNWLIPAGSTDGIRYKNGDTNNVRLSMTFKTTGTAARQATGAIFVQEMLAIGIEIIPTYYDSTAFFGPGGIIDTRTFDIAEYTTNYCRNTLDETCVPFAMYHNGDPGNVAHYNSADAETDWINFWAATTHADRLTYAVEHQAFAMIDLPYFPLFTRTGPLTISGNAGTPGAKISWTDGTPKSVTASATGAFSITVPYDWSGTIKPSKTGLTFTPASRSYSKLLSSRTAQNFSAIQPFASTGFQDGWILESGENTTVGGTKDSTATTFILGDDSLNRQYRSILSFNTAALPDTAVIQSATLKIKQSGVPTGVNPFSALGNLLVDIRKPYIGTSGLFELFDFNAPATLGVGTFNKTPSLGWYSATLNAAGRSNINKTGLTQIRLRFSLDDNNNHLANLMRFFSGEAVAANRPLLTITYTMP